MSRAARLNDENYSAVVITSPWGLGLVGASGASATVTGAMANATRVGGWLFNTHDNRFGPAGGFFSGGAGGVLVRSGWGLGLLRRASGAWNVPFISPNGARLGDWLLDTATNEFIDAGDLNQDGRAELLATSPWGIGVLAVGDANLGSIAMHQNGTRLGGWLLNTGDNDFLALGDVNNDRRAELLVRSPWGLGILALTDGALTSILTVSNGTKVGDWTVDTTSDRFFQVGDLDGDGRAEIGVVTRDALVILRVEGASLVQVSRLPNGALVGGWRMNTADNRFGPVGDFDRDGRTEIFLASPWGIGVLDWNGAGFTVSLLAQNGTSLEGWRINTADNRFNVAGDFDGDGADEVLVSSPWGLAFLRMNGKLGASGVTANGSRPGGWNVNTADNDLEAASSIQRALLIFHGQWGGVVSSTRDELVRRGFVVETTDTAATGLAMLQRIARISAPGDRLFVYLAGHGDSARIIGATDVASAEGHRIQFNDGELWTRDLSPIFRSIANAGTDLSVLDGSCDGGETVLAAQDQRYCAMATTGVLSPGLTGIPNPADAFKLDGRPTSFGLWWSQPRRLASWLNGAIIRWAPTRIYQRLMRNDRSPFAARSIFYRTALDAFMWVDLGGWSMRENHYLYLFPYIYEADYNNLPAERRALYTRSTQLYVDAMNGPVAAYASMLAELKQVLSDADLMTRAGAVYAAHFVSAWQTLAGDPAWDPTGNPEAHVGAMAGLNPSFYIGVPGFLKIAAEILANITFIERCYARQLDLLWKIDAAVRAAASKELIKIPKLSVQPITIKPRSSPEVYQQFNRFELQLATDYRELRRSVLGDTRAVTTIAQLRSLSTSKVANDRILTDNVSKLKAHMPAVKAATVSLEALVKAFKAVTVELIACISRTSFLLSFVEDSVCHVQSQGLSNPGDVNLD